MSTVVRHPDPGQGAFNNPDVLPCSWYPLMPSSWLRKGQVQGVRLGRLEIAVYRTETGAVHAVDARCPHLGVNLAHGCVEKDAIQCPFHHWRFGPDGRCVPQKARIRRYPVLEQWGFIWLFNGEAPAFDLPAPTLNGRPVPVRHMGSTRFNCHPHVLAANGFDMSHLSALHRIRLCDEPRVEEHACSIAVEWAGYPLDAWARRLCGRQPVSVRHVIYGGNIVWLQVRSPLEYHVVYARRPEYRHQTQRWGAHTESFLFARKRDVLNPRMLASLIYHASVLMDDRKLLEDIVFTPNFSPADAVLERFYRYINSLEATPCA